MLEICVVLTERLVALLAEGVDRNCTVSHYKHREIVALLAEGVDRNPFGRERTRSKAVALLAEGVDRNWIMALM